MIVHFPPSSLEFKFLTANTVWGSRCITMPNFFPVSQAVAEIWRFFDFFKTVAIHHLGFVIYVSRPPTKSIWWSLSLRKIGWFQCNSSDNNAGFDILRARLKNTYTCPQNQGFGEFQPPLWQHCQRDPTKHVMFR